MGFVHDPERWVGLLVALGVLLPMTLWFVARAGGPRTRAVVGVVAGAFLLYAAAGALGRTSVVGHLLGYEDSFREDGFSTDTPELVGLFVAGATVGLLLALLLRGRSASVDDEPADAPVDAPVEEPDDTAADETVVDETVVDEPAGARWSSHLAATPPAAGSMTPAHAALLLVAVALAVPMQVGGVGSDYGLFRISEVGGWEAAAYVLDGVLVGLAVLFAALALRSRDVPLIGFAFLLAATGQGVSVAFPDTVANEEWFMVGTGLVAGLLLPTALHLLRNIVTDDAVALVTGVAVAIALVAASTGLDARALRDSVPQRADVDVDVDVDIDGDVDVVVPPIVVPTPFPSVIVPTFEFPSGFPTDFSTFEFPSGFPMGGLN